MNWKDIELSHLRCFVALGEELHFGRAAARLHMAQPPLTRQIQMIESRLDCSLFARTSRSTRLTPAGDAFLARARAILAEAERTFQAMQRLGRGEEGRLTVATAPSLMLDELPAVIRAFRRKYPAVEFRLEEMASSAILEAVRAGAADLGFVRGRDKDRDTRTHLQWKESMVAIVPRAFDAGAPFAIARLRTEPFVFFPRHLGPSFFDEVVASCQRAGLTIRVAQEARQWSSILSLVSAGMGVSIGPRSVSALLPKAVRCLALPGVTTTVRVVGGVRAGNPAVGNFLALAGPAYGTFDQLSLRRHGTKEQQQ